MTQAFIDVVEKLTKIKETYWPFDFHAMRPADRAALTENITAQTVAYFQNAPYASICDSAYKEHAAITRMMVEGLDLTSEGSPKRLEKIVGAMTSPAFVTALAVDRRDFFVTSLLVAATHSDTRLVGKARLELIDALMPHWQSDAFSAEWVRDSSSPLAAPAIRSALETFLEETIRRTLDRDDFYALEQIMRIHEKERAKSADHKNRPLINIDRFAVPIAQSLRRIVNAHDERIESHKIIRGRIYGALQILRDAVGDNRTMRERASWEFELVATEIAKAVRRHEENAALSALEQFAAACPAGATAVMGRPPSTPVAPADRQGQEGGTKGRGRRKGNGPKAPAPGGES